MRELNVFGLREYSRKDLFEDTTDEIREADRFYIMHEADNVIAEITEGAISMFRCSETCRGLDLKSPLGKIANIAFKHWNYVELIQNKNTQLQEDKEHLRQNNHHLLDEIERLKEKMERRERRHKYKRCLAMAKWCENAILGWMGYKELFSSHQRYIKVMLFTKWNKRWLELANKFKEAK